MFLWKLTLIASRLLESARERETLLGDIEERELNGSIRGLGEVLALVGSRQLRCWATWRPWVASVALFPAMARLIDNALSISAIVSKYPWESVAPSTPEQLANMSVAGGICTAIWSWCLGYGLGRVARASWVSALAVLVFAGMLFIAIPTVNATAKASSALFTALLVIAPACGGLWYRMTRTSIRTGFAVGLAAVSLLALSICFANPYALLAMTILFLWPILLPQRKNCQEL